MRAPKLLLASFLLTLGFVGGGCYANGFGQSSANIAYGPPAPTGVYYQARANNTWIEGRWNWVNNAWQWQPGYWLPNRSGQVYVQGYWNQQASGWAFVDGGWTTQRVGHTYSRGYWNNQGASRVWVRGSWLRNRPGQNYRQGRWTNNNGRQTWQRGSWSTRSSVRRSGRVDHRTPRTHRSSSPRPTRRSSRSIYRRR